MNRLAGQKSPYLLQHAGNPVDWHPWGEEAFARARAEGKPVFLSIGYSTCHWCHVMERESFSDPAIAELLNAHFVSIKVDREERPDVDRVYMTAVQLMTGQGGWPLSAFLTPELKPFFGGTYFPPDSRWGRPGFADLLRRIADLWSKDREKLASSGEELARAVRAAVEPGGRASPPRLGECGSGGGAAIPGTRPGRPGEAPGSAPRRLLESYRATFDPVHGGFGGAPKFPMPVDHGFLLAHHARTRDAEALEMSVYTLRQMARGGVFDQLGGGFHRYSTDERWHVPHFEKMLYDNAQLAAVYADAWRITGDAELEETARRTLDYVLRDLTHPDGGFYSAEDADSLPREPAGAAPAERGERAREGGEEGAFYVWEKAEVLRVLGGPAGEIFCHRYGVESNGNAAFDPQGEFRGRNILHQAYTLEETAKRFQKPRAWIAPVLSEARERLLAERSRRPRPRLDDKILASWNGLMISGLARAGGAFGDARYVAAAGRAARFLEERLYDPRGRRLYRRWRDGDRSVEGTADDYAFLIQGLLDLYEAALEPHWLAWAAALAEEALRLFFDADNGGFYLTSEGADASLFARVMEDTDNVEPAASSVLAESLLRLLRTTGREAWRAAAEKTFARFGEALEARPRAMPRMVEALELRNGKPLHVVLAGRADDPGREALAREVRRRFLPDLTLLAAEPESAAGGDPLEDLPLIKEIRAAARQGGAAAYVCVNFACRLPVLEPKILGGMLDGILKA